MEDDNKKLISYGITKDSLIIVKGVSIFIWAI